MFNPWLWTTMFFYLTTGFWMMAAVTLDLEGVAFIELPIRGRLKFAFFALIWLPILLYLISATCQESIKKRVGGDRS